MIQKWEIPEVQISFENVDEWPELIWARQGKRALPQDSLHQYLVNINKFIKTTKHIDQTRSWKLLSAVSSKKFEIHTFFLNDEKVQLIGIRINNYSIVIKKDIIHFTFMFDGILFIGTEGNGCAVTDGSRHDRAAADWRRVGAGRRWIAHGRRRRRRRSRRRTVRHRRRFPCGSADVLRRFLHLLKLFYKLSIR